MREKCIRVVTSLLIVWGLLSIIQSGIIGNNIAFTNDTMPNVEELSVLGTYSGTSRIDSVSCNYKTVDAISAQSVRKQYVIMSITDITFRLLGKDGRYYTDFFDKIIEITIDESTHHFELSTNMEDVDGLRPAGSVNFSGGINKKHDYIALDGGYTIDSINGVNALHSVYLTVKLDLISGSGMFDPETEEIIENIPENEEINNNQDEPVEESEPVKENTSLEISETEHKITGTLKVMERTDSILQNEDKNISGVGKFFY